MLPIASSGKKGCDAGCFTINRINSGNLCIQKKGHDIVTVRSSCGKVMFSQACVKNSVHREGVVYTPQADTPHP